MPERRPFGRALLDAAVMLTVAAASLFLLAYVGYGEASRAYPRFIAQKLEAQAELIRSAMDSYLQAGLPLRQFVGFATLAEPILASDPSIAQIAVRDRQGRRLFTSGDPQADAHDVALPLRNRFEGVGEVTIAMRPGAVTDRLADAFRPLLALAVVLSLGFAAYATGRRSRQRMVQVAYGLSFAAMAAAVVWTLVALYAEGAQAKARALADSLGHRVGALLELGLSLDDVEGLDRTLADYRRLNPDITAAALIERGVAVIHSDAARQGRPWSAGKAAYDYVVPIAGERFSVAVALPAELVWHQVGRSVKNFAALFLASALLAGLFLRLATGVDSAPQGPVEERAVRLVAPAFFIAVFLEHLLYPFLPALLQGVTAEAGLSPGWASALFMTYFLCFALSLIPAGQLAERHGAKPLVVYGAVGIVIGMALLALSRDLAVVLAARAIAGTAQGALFIGVQSFLLAAASPARKTQAAAVIVTGFQGGMIAGSAIGSLLVVYLGPTGIFLLGAATGAGLLLYAAWLLPTVARVEPTKTAGGPAGLWRDIARAATDPEFLKTMLTVGIPSKAVLTGVVVFALPLMLSQRRFDQEDIGQNIMLYALGVMLASGLVARLVDRTGGTAPVLFAGSLLAAAGLGAIGLVGLTAGPASLGVLLAAVVLMGLAHGCINAPIITHIADSELAARIGGAKATATYRFLERLGHVGGPIITGQLLWLTNGAPVLLAWIGGGLAGLALLFLVPLSRRREATV